MPGSDEIRVLPSPRKPTSGEIEVLTAIAKLASVLEDQLAIMEQCRSAVVVRESIDPVPWLWFEFPPGTDVQPMTSEGVVAEGTAPDADGELIAILLHAGSDRRMKCLEYYRPIGGDVMQRPDPSKIVLETFG